MHKATIAGLAAEMAAELSDEAGESMMKELQERLFGTGAAGKAEQKREPDHLKLKRLPLVGAVGGD